MCAKYIYKKKKEREEKNIVISQENDFQKTQNKWEGEISSHFYHLQ